MIITTILLLAIAVVVQALLTLALCNFADKLEALEIDVEAVYTELQRMGLLHH